jgi:inner membrane protein
MPAITSVRGTVLRASAVLVVATVALVLDSANRRIPYGVLSTGPIDEGAHLATAVLTLLAVGRLVVAPRRFYVAALVASVALDLDHVPAYLSGQAETARPVTHSLATVAAVLAVAALVPRHRVLLVGVAVGLGTHLVRDVTEGTPGVRMLWPLDGRSWMAGQPAFVTIVAVLTVATLVLLAVDRYAPVCMARKTAWRSAAPTSAESPNWVPHE